MEPEDKVEGTAIDIEDLLVGEENAMQMAGASFASLYTIKPKYLRSLIARLEADTSGQTQSSIPLFKLMLFYAENLKEHVQKDPALKKAMDDAKQRAEMRQMFGR